MGTSSESNVLEEQIRECYGRVVWTQKTHEKCADILNARLNHIKLAQIILSAAITTGILFSTFGKSTIIGIVSAFLSFILTLVNTYLKQYDLGGIAQKHADSAIALWSIREDYLSLLTDMQTKNIDLNELRKSRDLLKNAVVEVYKGSPRTLSKAYKAASKSLKEQEELTLSDEEIDKFLPKTLKKNQSR